VVSPVLAFLMLLAPLLARGTATPTPVAPGIPPVFWRVVGFSEPNQAPVTIADPTQYTLQFLPQRLLVAQFDCNQGRGGYTVVEGGLTLTPMAVTTAMCAPESYSLTVQRVLAQVTAYRFNPEVGHLVLRGEGGVLDLHPQLTGVVWQWQETRSNTGEVTLRPEDPTHYTLEFLPDDTLAIQADCNHAMGTYTVTSAQLDLQTGGVTRMACPPGSLMDPYLRQLDQAVSYTIQQTLTLALSGGGVMQFTAVVSTPATATPEAG
jgi:heat shock protein HslJ